MKMRFVGLMGTTLALLLQLPAHAVNWKMLANCYFIGADGKQQIDDVCQIEGGSGQGMEGFTISWKDGVKTKVSGNFVTGQNYQVDGRPAVMKRVNNVTVLRTYSGNVIIFHKIRELRPRD
ncbi:MAG: hypothetical protein KME42_03735 [Tildeniella nuda ZEHNDER 1965/U140]|jgi:hypothetical protein|nr:hypothetical protein [Tildeniella nuda ZEHNDER 1965/U140]